MQSETVMSVGDVSLVDAYVNPGDGGGGDFVFMAPSSVPAQEIVQISVTSGSATVTVTTQSPHGLVVGGTVVVAVDVSGSVWLPSGINGVWTVATAAGTTFTFAYGSTFNATNQTTAGTLIGFVADGGTSFAPAAPHIKDGLWKRRFSGPLDVRWFGAVGDSDMSHGSGADNTAAFGAALTTAAATGGEVLVPIGLFRVTAKLTVPPGVTIRGQASAFQGVGPMSAIVADHLDHTLASVAPPDGSNTGLVQLRNLRISGVKKNCPNLITDVTQANPCVVTCIGHGLVDRQVVFISGAGGM
jgi:hypothetical protein